MQRVITDQIERTINTNQLRALVPPYCRVVRYDALKHKRTLADCMGKSTVLIILFNIHDAKHRVLNEPGHFFVLSTRGPEKCVVFSSTGMTPKKELFITRSDPTLFERILPRETVFNKKKLQINRSSNTCWRWCLVYAYLAPLGLKKFIRLFSRPSLTLTHPDQLVTALTFLSLF